MTTPIFRTRRLVGIDTEGYRVYVNVELRQESGQKTTITHEDIWNPVCASFTVESAHWCGACVDTLTPNLFRSLSVTPETLAIMAQLAAEWHLNTMKAGCIHQGQHNTSEWDTTPQRPMVPVPGFIGYAPGKLESHAAAWKRVANEKAPCPQGYVYGSCWLVKPLTGEAETAIRGLETLS